jgi:hypothetical protein
LNVELSARCKDLEIEFEMCNVHTGRWNVKIVEPDEEQLVRWDVWDAPLLWPAIFNLIGARIEHAVTDMLFPQQFRPSPPVVGST